MRPGTAGALRRRAADARRVPAADDRADRGHELRLQRPLRIRTRPGLRLPAEARPDAVRAGAALSRLDRRPVVHSAGRFHPGARNARPAAPRHPAAGPRRQRLRLAHRRLPGRGALPPRRSRRRRELRRRVHGHRPSCSGPWTQACISAPCRHACTSKRAPAMRRWRRSTAWSARRRTKGGTGWPRGASPSACGSKPALAHVDGARGAAAAAPPRGALQRSAGVRMGRHPAGRRNRGRRISRWPRSTGAPRRRSPLRWPNGCRRSSVITSPRGCASCARWPCWGRATRRPRSKRRVRRSPTRPGSG